MPPHEKSRGRDLGPAARLSVFCGPLPFAAGYPLYANGTSTHALQRGHLALTWPVAALTRRMAFLTINPSSLGTTILVRQTGHRLGSFHAATNASRLMASPEVIPKNPNVSPKITYSDRQCQE